MKPIYHVYDCTGNRTLSRHRKLSQAGASYLAKQSRPILMRVLVEFPRGILGFDLDRTRAALEACSRSKPARKAARLPSRGLYGPGSVTSADVARTLGKSR